MDLNILIVLFIDHNSSLDYNGIHLKKGLKGILLVTKIVLQIKKYYRKIFNPETFRNEVLFEIRYDC